MLHIYSYVVLLKYSYSLSDSCTKKSKVTCVQAVTLTFLEGTNVTLEKDSNFISIALCNILYIMNTFKA